MSPDSIPSFSLGTAALIIFAVCAGYVILRGLTRMIVGSVVLSLSVWIGFQVWQQAPSISLELAGKPQSWLANGLPIAAFIVSFFLLRKIAKFLARPFGNSDAESRPLSPILLSMRLLFALFPTALIGLVGATLVHHSGAVAEVRAYSEKSSGVVEATPSGFWQRLKSSVEEAIPARWLQILDPITDPARITLAKLITSQADLPLKPVIDPRTGKPIPRAIIVDDPDLQTLAREGNFGTLLRHPSLTKALADPKLQRLLSGLHL